MRRVQQLHSQPPKNAKWEKEAMEVHGIWINQERIKEFHCTLDIWPRFVNFVEPRLKNGVRREHLSDNELNTILAATRTKGNRIIPAYKMLQFMLRESP